MNREKREAAPPNDIMELLVGAAYNMVVVMTELERKKLFITLPEGIRKSVLETAVYLRTQGGGREETYRRARTDCNAGLMIAHAVDTYEEFILWTAKGEGRHRYISALSRLGVSSVTEQVALMEVRRRLDVYKTPIWVVLEEVERGIRRIVDGFYRR